MYFKFHKIMDFTTYIVSNIPLFAISAVMLFLAIRNIQIRKRESIYFIVFVGVVLLLSVVVTMEDYAQLYGIPVLGTIFTSLGYIFRPFALVIFLLLANMGYRRSKLFYYLAFIPPLLNTIVYLLPLFFGVPGVSTIVFYYVLNPDGTASFVRGGPLNFLSHVISAFLLGMVAYVSLAKFNGKHRRDGIILIISVFIILATVVAEMVFDRSDLLNIVCDICGLIIYIYIISVNSSKDPLTDLYDRRAYYEDVARYKGIINGVIQIDMNELKYVNDNFGHNEGDNALYTLAKIFQESIDLSSMCVYRISGDEFVILMFKGKEEEIDSTVERMREKISKTNYTAAIGSCLINKEQGIGFEEALKKSEELMYADKNEHYKTSGHDRRKA